MIKKRGFTLVELIAVISILALIATLVTPLVYNAIERAKDQVLAEQKERLVEATKRYNLENNIVTANDDGMMEIVAFNDLVKAGYVENKDIINAKTGEELEGCIIVAYVSSNQSFLYQYSTNCTDSSIYDITPPTNLQLYLISRTADTMIIKVYGEDAESGIDKYEINIDKNSYIDLGTNDEYTFTNLNTGSHFIDLRVTNKLGLTSIQNFEVATLTTPLTAYNILSPIFTISTLGWAPSKTLTINYPELSGYSYEYSYNGSTYSSTTSETTLSFSANKTVYARIKVGEIYSRVYTYNVNKIDSVTPLVGVEQIASTNDTITVKATSNNTDSGIAKYEFKIDSGSYIDNGTDDTYIFTSVSQAVHACTVRATSFSGIVSNPTTISIQPLPPTDIIITADEGWATSKTVTITYPTKQSNYIYEYKINAGPWTVVNSGIYQSLVFTANGYLSARIYSGSEVIKATTFNVTGIDNTNPSTPLLNTSTSDGESITANYYDSTDAESGIDHYTCYYGLAADQLVNDGNVTTPTCYFDNLTTSMTYYFKICATNGIGYTACSVVSNKDTIYTDTTPPTNVTVNEVSKTTNSITVSTSATDSGSAITKYEFSIDSGTYIDNGTTSSYTFNNLTSGSHTFKIRATNAFSLSTESTTVTISTNSISSPTYAISPASGYATSKVVTISYPSGTGLTYTYNKDGTGYVTATQSQNVTFSANGYVTARVSDGTNTVTASTYNVTGIDTTAPSTPVLSNSSATSNTITAVYGTSTDAESGINNYKCYYGTTSSPSTLGSVSSTTCTFSGLSSYTTYYFKMCATNGAGLTTCSVVSNKKTSSNCTSTTTTYGTWSSWSSCTKSCGTGTQSRTRSVTVTSTIDGGVCSTSTETETQNCNTFSCCSSTYESCDSWGTCDASCESYGYEYRTCYLYSNYDYSYCGSYSDSQSCYNSTSCGGGGGSGYYCCSCGCSSCESTSQSECDTDCYNICGGSCYSC